MNKKIIALISITILVILVILFTVFLGFGGKGGKDIARGETKRADSWIKGAKDSRIEIIEFSDFQCPACGMAEPEVKKVLDFYKDKVTFYYRHFPLPQHKFSKVASRVCEAAGKQGKFWEMHDLIFQNQSKLSDELFQKLAKDLNLDLEKFNQDLKDPKITKKIEQDLKDAESLGVNSTPTFFINGEKLEGGGLTFADWQSIIDKKLKE